MTEHTARAPTSKIRNDTGPTLGIVGGGAWGTALASTLCAAGRPALLWARNSATVDDINTNHCNTGYLPNIALPDHCRATTDLAEVASRDIVLLVTPAQHIRATAQLLAKNLRAKTPVIVCAKGIEQSTGALLLDVLTEMLPTAIPAVLSGPSFADDVARGLPAALTIATANADLGQDLAARIGTRHFRLYWSDDLIGVQLGGAIKNVLAIAAGILDGRGLGASAHAALVTRGFAELRRFGIAAGARPATLMGLSGLGDLLLTCGSAQSRNMSLGRALGQGQSLEQVLGARRSVSEGIYTAGIVARLAQQRDIAMPVCAAVAAIVSGACGIDEAIEGLLTRPFKAED